MKALMEHFRREQENMLPAGTVKHFTDYAKGPEVTGLPVSNVLYYEMEDSWLYPSFRYGAQDQALFRSEGRYYGNCTKEDGCAEDGNDSYD